MMPPLLVSPLRLLLPSLLLLLLLASRCVALRPQWCPALHTIQGNDPSGPMFVDGVWHVFVTCDDGPSWGHYTSPDLVHWTVQQPTNWDSATGSVAPAPSGGGGGSFVAFWPNTSTPFPCCNIDSATTANASLQGWRHTGQAIARPAELSLHQGFRDPHRPLKLAGKWRMGVGSGSGADNVVPLAGRIRWFTATDDTLSAWEDSGTFFEVNETAAGYVDADAGVVWNATWRRTFNQIECPDVFAMSDHLVVLGSLQYLLRACIQYRRRQYTSDCPCMHPDLL
jgi:sucrose-6-phosphate hydrolase SacC (GH32 family)